MVDTTLYPEAAGGGLGPALAAAARRHAVDIGDVVPEPGDYGFFAVTMSYGPRRVAVDVGARERAFIVKASAGPGISARGITADIADVVRVAGTWRQGVSLRELHSRFPFMTYTRLAEGFERGNPLDVQWAEVLDDPDLGQVHPLLRAAREHPRLRHLFPTVTHYTLVRLHFDPIDRSAGQLRIALTARGYEVASTWDEGPRVVATIEEAIEAALSLLPNGRAAPP